MESNLLDIVKEFCCFNIPNLAAQSSDQLFGYLFINNPVNKADFVWHVLIENNPAYSSQQNSLLFKL